MRLVRNPAAASGIKTAGNAAFFQTHSTSRLTQAGRYMFAAKCPHCRSVDFREVGVQNFLERAIHWLLLPYRCELCGRHFFIFRWLQPAAGPV